ncbi:MAG TPA: glycosyltransferase family 87 protein [Clostridia bacterium]|nr:glycosyltransferase family 87 protein [Clostridia bacterium]
METKEKQPQISQQKRLVVYCILIFVIYVLMFFFFLFSNVLENGTGLSEFGIDFADYYTAGHMAISGELDSVYSVPAHRATMEQVLGVVVPFTLPWRYPPVFLLAIIPFSLLPFKISMVLWLGVTLVLAAVAIFRMLPEKRWLGALALGFPGVFMNFRWGQNGFLSAAILAAGVGALEINPVLGGAMLGLLVYKPQFAVFPFLILLLTKRWKALLSAIASALAISLASMALFGVDQWIEFFRSLFVSSSNLMEAESATIAAIQVSVYNSMMVLTESPLASMLAQGICSLGAIIAVCWIFRKSDRFALKGAALVLGIPLAIPYFMQYDLMILAVPLVLLAYDYSKSGFRKNELIITTLVWFLPVISWPLMRNTGIQICPLLLAFQILMIFKRVKRENTLPAILLPAQDTNLPVDIPPCSN